MTFTLPVNGHQLMLSSILASILEILAVILATVAATLLGMGVCALGLPWNEVPADFWPRLWEQLGAVWSEFARYGDIAVQAALMMLLGALSQLIVLMLAVTIGGMAAKKHPILMAILVYYGISLVWTIIEVTVLVGNGALNKTLSVMGTMNVLAAVTIVGGYFIMYFLTTRKLNLN